MILDAKKLLPNEEELHKLYEDLVFLRPSSLLIANKVIQMRCANLQEALESYKNIVFVCEQSCKWYRLGKPSYDIARKMALCRIDQITDQGG